MPSVTGLNSEQSEAAHPLQPLFNEQNETRAPPRTPSLPHTYLDLPFFGIGYLARGRSVTLALSMMNEATKERTVPQFMTHSPSLESGGVALDGT